MPDARGNDFGAPGSLPVSARGPAAMEARAHTPTLLAGETPGAPESVRVWTPSRWRRRRVIAFTAAVRIALYGVLPLIGGPRPLWLIAFISVCVIIHGSALYLMHRRRFIITTDGAGLAIGAGKATLAIRWSDITHLARCEESSNSTESKPGPLESLLNRMALLVERLGGAIIDSRPTISLTLNKPELSRIFGRGSGPLMLDLTGYSRAERDSLADLIVDRASLTRDELSHTFIRRGLPPPIVGSDAWRLSAEGPGCSETRDALPG